MDDRYSAAHTRLVDHRLRHPKRLVSLFHPYGDDDTPDGKPGLENGFLRKNGVFTIHLAEFTAVFEGLYLENTNEKDRFKGATAD
jgi:hypothetical protein